jgi:hypothetical protein
MLTTELQHELFGGNESWFADAGGFIECLELAFKPHTACI